jgi:hypothetical protein
MNLRPTHELDNRMRLNNLLQVNGGVQRLNWTETKFGPEHCPVWRVGCLSTFKLFLPNDLVSLITLRLQLTIFSTGKAKVIIGRRPGKRQPTELLLL